MLRTRQSFIFVSYANEDKDVVYPEIKRFDNAGYKTWYDKKELRPGHIWYEEIDKAIEACSCFVVFMTRAAAKSQHVLEEMGQALQNGKPFICIYWEKVRLPFRFQEPIQRIQALERFALHRHEYEETLDEALREYAQKHPSPPVCHKGPNSALVLSSSDSTSGINPKVVCFVLLLLTVCAVLFSVAAALTPFFAGHKPGDPLGTRWVGVLTGCFFLVLAVLPGTGAFVVYRKYLRRRNG